MPVYSKLINLFFFLSQRESPAVLVDSFMVPNQLPQEQKFHNQLYLGGNTLVNPAQQLQFRQQAPQNANKQNMQTIMSQVVLQTEKRPEEEQKVVEPVTETLNAGTQKTAEKMRKDEGMRVHFNSVEFKCSLPHLICRSWAYGHHFGRAVCQY